MTKRKGEKKTAVRTLRTTERIAYAAELAALFENSNDNSVMEIAIRRYTGEVLKRHELDLDDLFHIHPGMRKLKLFLLKGVPLSDYDEALRNFCLEHLDFFYRPDGAGGLAPFAPSVETLWDKKAGVSKYQALGVKRYWASGEAMAKALVARGIDPPEWPPQEQESKPRGAQRKAK